MSALQLPHLRKAVAGAASRARMWWDPAMRRVRVAHPDGTVSSLATTSDTGSGTGDVVGPASATAGAPAVFDGTTGKLIKQLIGDGVLGLVSGVLTKITSTLGDLVYGGASGTPTRLAGNTTTTMKVLTQTGDGAASAAPAWTAISGLTVGTASAAGVLKLGAAGGASVYRTPSQVLSAHGTMTADVEHLRVTAACVVTLPAVSTCTIGFRTVIVVESTTEIVVQLSPNASDKIEGAALAGLIATRGVYVLTPTAANKWSLAALIGLAQWVHASYDLTTASGASPWTINGSTWTDISSASSSVAASSGLQFTAKSVANYVAAASADCAVVRTPLSGVVDGWSRPLAITDTFWLLTKTSRTTSVGGSNPTVGIGLGGAALSNTPRVTSQNRVDISVVGIGIRDTQTRNETSATSSFTAAGWLGYLWDGTEIKVRELVATTSASGSPGAASGWWPLSYVVGEHFDYGRTFYGNDWQRANFTNIHIHQTNSTTGSKFTYTDVVVVRQIGVRS